MSLEFTLEEKNIALTYLEQDIYDDFWPDYLSYKDLLNSELINLNYNDFKPSPLLIMLVPKATLIPRPGHYINLKDRYFLQLIVNKFARQINECMLKNNSSFYGYKISADTRFFIKNSVQNWIQFTSNDKENFFSNSSGCLIVTDISAFFEHIKIDKLINIIEPHVQSESKEFLIILNKILRSWSIEGIGIPQGNNICSFLSNIYLSKIDQYFIDNNFKYTRFVDDIHIFCKDKIEAMNTIKQLSTMLKEYNLHLNSGKTKILNYEEYQEIELENKLKGIDYLVDNVNDENEFNDLVSEKLENLWKQYVNINKINKSIFNFCIIRFNKINSSFPLNDILKNDLYDAAYSKEIHEYLKRYINNDMVQNKVFEIINVTNSEYQLIYLIKTLLEASKMQRDLSTIDTKRIYSLNNFLLTGYIILLFNKFGTVGQREKINLEFKQNNFQDNEKILRYYMISKTFNSQNLKIELKKVLDINNNLKLTKDYLLERFVK